MPQPLVIDELEWDEENESHIERRIDVDAIEDFLDAGEFFAFTNSRDHAPGRIKLIGRMPGGATWVVILQASHTGHPGRWRPVTCFPAGAEDRRRYDGEFKRLRSKGGRND